MWRNLRVFLAVSRNRLRRVILPKKRVYQGDVEIIPAFDPTLPTGFASYTAHEKHVLAKRRRRPRDDRRL